MESRKVAHSLAAKRAGEKAVRVRQHFAAFMPAASLSRTQERKRQAGYLVAGEAVTALLGFQRLGSRFLTS